MKKQIATSLLALAMVTAVPTLAWSQDQHADHAPEVAAPAAPKAPAAPTNTNPNAKATPPVGRMSGMDNCGMMMGGMMQGGMMQSDRSRPGSMMQGNMPGMMGMMMGDMKMSEHIDARLKELRGALEITEGQANVWDSFARALRGAAARMDAAHQQMHPQGAARRRSTAVECLDRHNRMLTQVHDGLRSLRPSLVRLYDVLSPEQKAKADELLILPHAMMPRMAMPNMIGR